MRREIQELATENSFPISSHFQKKLNASCRRLCCLSSLSLALPLPLPLLLPPLLSPDRFQLPSIPHAALASNSPPTASLSSSPSVRRTHHNLLVVFRHKPSQTQQPAHRDWKLHIPFSNSLDNLLDHLVSTLFKLHQRSKASPFNITTLQKPSPSEYNNHSDKQTSKPIHSPWKRRWRLALAAPLLKKPPLPKLLPPIQRPKSQSRAPKSTTKTHVATTIETNGQYPSPL